MPLPVSHGDKFIRISRVFVDSEERTSGTTTNYEFKMNKEIQEVIGIELTGYAIPSSMTPSFITDVNDCLDFSLSNGVTTKVFTAIFPSESYTYENVSNPYLSYVLTLKQILEESVFFDPVFGNGGTHRFYADTISDPNTRTDLVARAGTGITEFRFLFGSGPCNDRSPRVAMGFTDADTPAATTRITSPFQTKLDSFPRVNIFVKEFPELSPLDIVYNNNAAYYGTTYNDTNVTRTPFLSDKPLQRLNTLHIRMEISGELVPDLPKNEHSLCFTIFSVDSEEYVPRWLNQSFVL